jgi:type I restriction enzyme S subunit
MDRPWIEAGLKYATISKYDLPCLLVQRTARLRGGPKLDNGYLRYLIGSQEFTHHIHAITTGTAVPHISGRQIKDFAFALPPIVEQKAIAAVLEALDDKIELNRRMNATLEAMARALFQSWFVDFDPVRAKLDGRPPAGLDAATAPLFPATFQESPQGPVPHGWEVGRLDDVLTLQRGFDLPTPDRTHGKYPVMAASGPNGWHDKFMVRGPGVTTGRSGVLGRVFFVHGDFWPLNTSLWVKEFKRISPAYAFHLLRGLDFEVFNAGSAVPTLNRNHVHNLPVVMPPQAIVKAFDAQVMPLMTRQKANEDQSHTLATLRDTLLPKLLSGELDVSKVPTPGTQWPTPVLDRTPQA